MRGYKFRLYPTHEQEQRLVETLDGCRWIYNYFLNQKIRSKYDMQFALTELKEQKQWLRNYHSKMLQMVIHKIDAANKSLTTLRKNGHKVGRLHLLTHDEYNSFTYNQSGFRIERHGNTDLLWLSKIGFIEIRLHRTVQKIKQVIICRQARNKWYAIITCELAKLIFKLINLQKSVGIDVGITKFCHDSDNYAMENPLFLKQELKKLKRTSRKLQRRKKNSQNWYKAKSRLQVLHERIRNKRIDFLHKASRYYSDRYDLIFVERLRMLNMVKNHHLARHVLDSGWSTFKILLDYKAKRVIEVDSRNTSINCSKCSNKVPKSLAIRIHRCDKCGIEIDRDYNASLNIKQRGLRLLVGHEEVTPVEILGESMKQEQAIVQSIASPPRL